MTGWRCGWSIGPAAAIAAQTALQSSLERRRSQKAAIAALTGSQESVSLMLDEYRTRRDNLHQWLTGDSRIRCRKPAGAFYLFPDLNGILKAGGFATSNDFAQALLNEYRVAVTPGLLMRSASCDLARHVHGESVKAAAAFSTPNAGSLASMPR